MRAEWPKKIGCWRRQAVVGRGGMGEVWEVERDDPKQIAAMKIMLGDPHSSERRVRFLRESQALANLSGGALLHVYERGTFDDRGVERPYYVMELVPGRRTLATWALEHGRTAPERAAMFARVCDAVQEMHSAGYWHRDLKPTNVLVANRDEPRIIDLGLVVGHGTEPPPDDEWRRANPNRQLGPGTRDFLTPEQCKSDWQSYRAPGDVYQLGLMLYLLLARRMPYRVHPTDDGLAKQAICETPPAPLGQIRGLDPLTSGRLWKVLRRALDKDPTRRQQDAGELAREVDSALRHRPARIALLLAACALAGFVLAETAGSAIVRQGFGGAAQSWFERSAHALVGPAPAPGDAVVVTLRTDEGVEKAAQSLQVQGVTAGDPKSFRLLHGAMMRLLADAGPSAVVFDISFGVDTPHDAAFVEGVRALAGKRIPVVAGSGHWRTSADGDVQYSAAIFPEIRWGAFTAEIDQQSPKPWEIDVALLRGSVTLPSLSLATAAALLEPRVRPRFELDPVNGEIVARFEEPSPTAAAGVRTVRDPMRWPVTRVLDNRATQELGIGDTDAVGYLQVAELPAKQVMAAMEIPIEEFMALSAADLERRCRGKVVFISDNRDGRDLHLAPDGRPDVPGVYGHVAALSILRQAAALPREVKRNTGLALSGAAAALGAASGALWLRRRWLPLAAAAGLCAAFIVLSLALFAFEQAMWNPMTAICAMMTACALGVWALWFRGGALV